MHPKAKADLLCFGETGSLQFQDWESGVVKFLPKAIDAFQKDVYNHLDETQAEWILFWDEGLGRPDCNLIESLMQKPVDVWHAGLRFGLQEKPEVLNYVYPTWMYNKDAPAEVESSSFRLSLRATLIRTSVLRQVFVDFKYSSVEMTGLALGYSVLKAGGIIRYHPDLVKKKHAISLIPLTDELRFAKEFFPYKWQLWILLNKPWRVDSFLTWMNLKDIHLRRLKPFLHSSKKRSQGNFSTKVSVLAPTLNRYSYLFNELEQLAKQTVLPCEVLITDQTDEHDRQEIYVNRYPGLTIRYFPQKEKGQCIAWNKLLEEAQGDYVLFLGDDADDIKPDFIEKLLATQQKFGADIVASNVIEAGITYDTLNEHYYLSDTFPITLVKRDLLLNTGFLDMFFNKNIRADHDLAMRCHLKGALMIFDSSATIFHHRAPVGGLRTHNARAVTSNMAKKSVSKFLNPTSSEIYLAKKYYNSLQVRNYVKIKYFNQLFVEGNFFKKLLRLVFFVGSIPFFYRNYKKNEQLADQQLKQNREQVIALRQ